MAFLGQFVVLAWLLLASMTTAENTTTSIHALNPLLTSTFDVGSGPQLFYNGSGPVPPEFILSPTPAPLPKMG